MPLIAPWRTRLATFKKSARFPVDAPHQRHLLGEHPPIRNDARCPPVTPQLTSLPPGLRDLKFSSHTEPPMLSKTRSTPLPPVISLTVALYVGSRRS